MEVTDFVQQQISGALPVILLIFIVINKMYRNIMIVKFVMYYLNQLSPAATVISSISVLYRHKHWRFIDSRNMPPSPSNGTFQLYTSIS